LIAGAIAAAFAGAVASGCSSKSDNGNSGPPDTAHFAGTMATTFCSALKSCCDAQKIQYDDGSCVAQLQANFQNAVDAVKHGKVVYDPNAVQKCQDAFKNREAQCTEDSGPPPGADKGFIDPITAACWPVLKGTVAPGGQCTASADCQTSGPNVSASCTTDTRPGADPTVRVCFTTTLHVTPGSACRATPKVDPSGTLSYDTARCEPTLGYCDTSQAPTTDRALGNCTAYANVGDNCVGTVGMTTPQCNPTTSVCDSFNTRTCVALPQAGSPCASFRCATGNYCDTTGGTGNMGTCAQSKPDGSSCKSSQECAGGFCQTMVGDGGITTGTCASNGNVAHDVYDISPRSCGFGPQGTGPEDAGIVPPASAAYRPSLGGDGQWYSVR
jgi:hypothetical protein